MLELYSPFTRTGAPIMVMDCASAELTKYAANAMLATRISFMNEVANVCELVGADVDQVRRAIGSDRRIGTSFLFPGVGYGGSCFPKDVQAMIRFAVGRRTTTSGSSRRSRRSTSSQKTRLFAKMKTHFGSLKGKTVAVWGLAFKPQDRRHARGAVDSAHRGAAVGGRHGAGLRSRGDEGRQGHLRQRRSPSRRSNYDALKGADCLAIVTEWNEFRRPDFDRMRTLMRSPVVFDGRNLFTPEQMKQNGFTYYSIGRH